MVAMTEFKISKKQLDESIEVVGMVKRVQHREWCGVHGQQSHALRIYDGSKVKLYCYKCAIDALSNRGKDDGV